MIQRLLPETQGQNLALAVLHVALTVLHVASTVFYVPCSVWGTCLEIGSAVREAEAAILLPSEEGTAEKVSSTFA